VQEQAPVIAYSFSRLSAGLSIKRGKRKAGPNVISLHKLLGLCTGRKRGEKEEKEANTFKINKYLL
jgi:hypothetical protein